MGREENVCVFRDTEKMVKSEPFLSSAVEHSTEHQRLILEKDWSLGLEKSALKDRERYQEQAKVIVSKKRSYEAASAYKGMKACVHNFASATNPGGGVVKGSSAQEECLCRCSTLYFSLNTPQMWDGFYMPHRAQENPIHNDDIIYTPDVYVVKTDSSSPKRLPKEEWFKVNVITCAAPNLRSMPSNPMNIGDGSKGVKLSAERLQEIHERRIGRILDSALIDKNDVVILGAFGCGAFENDPKVVAEAAKNVIKDYMHAFKVIEFAIYCSARDEKNYEAFAQAMNE